MNDSLVDSWRGLFSLHSTEPWHCGIVPQERLADVERTAEEERHMIQQQLARASCPASAEVDEGICRKHIQINRFPLRRRLRRKFAPPKRSGKK